MKPKRQQGYTILETMIVLAVTSGLFIIAYLAFNGRQQKTQFTVATKDMASKIQDVINDVGVGYYPSTQIESGDDLDCLGFESPSSQGTNKNCIFVGKFIEVKPSEDKLIIHTLAGNRQTTGSPPKEVSSFSETSPQIIASLREEYKAQYGADIVSAKSSACSSNGGKILGFVVGTTFGSTVTINGQEQLDPESINANIYPICETIGSFNGIDIDIPDANIDKETVICLNNDYTNTSTAIIVNKDNQKGSVITEVGSTSCT